MLILLTYRLVEEFQYHNIWFMFFVNYTNVYKRLCKNDLSSDVTKNSIGCYEK